MANIKFKVKGINNNAGYKILKVYRRGWYEGEVVVYDNVISQYNLSDAVFGSVDAIIKSRNQQYIS